MIWWIKRLFGNRKESSNRRLFSIMNAFHINPKNPPKSRFRLYLKCSNPFLRQQWYWKESLVDQFPIQLHLHFATTVQDNWDRSVFLYHSILKNSLYRPFHFQ